MDARQQCLEAGQVAQWLKVAIEAGDPAPPRSVRAGVALPTGSAVERGEFRRGLGANAKQRFAYHAVPFRSQHMRRTVSVLPLALLASPAFAGDAQDVQVKQRGEGRFELTVTLPDTTDPSNGQPALMPKAVELCGAKRPQLGKYKFESTTPMAGTGATSSTSLVFV